MKTKSLIMLCLCCLTVLLTSCDNYIESNKNNGRDADESNTKHPRSISDTIAQEIANDTFIIE